MSAPTMSNGVPLSALLEDYEFDPSRVERISHRLVSQPIEIVPYNPSWPSHFAHLRDRIVAALGPLPTEEQTSSLLPSSSASASPSSSPPPLLLSVHHTGSTSVPGLPAKNVIDIDLVLSDVSAEHLYVPLLEAQGLQFILREPHWHGHRFFCSYESPDAPPANIHVWGPRCPEAERHRIFRDWLIANKDDRELYAETKKECSRLSRENGEKMTVYNARKEAVIRQILQRAFRSLGYLQ